MRDESDDREPGFAPGTITPEDVELLYEELMIESIEARESFPKFFEFVMREEFTREPITTAPHQRVLMEFIMAHPKCLVKLPPGMTKTYTCAGLALWLLGLDPTLRGMVVSATQGQAEKPVGMVRDYIEDSNELHATFPALHRSTRKADSWTQTELTVQRPRGIRDPSLRAVGAGTAVEGSRLNWVLVDDILSTDNCATPESRAKLYQWFTTVLARRIDTFGTPRFIVTNTPMCAGDLVDELEKNGWPTISMRVDGTISISNTDWDSALIRPETDESPDVRLTAHDPDPKNTRGLWDAKYPKHIVEDIRKEMLPQHFSRMFLMSNVDDETALCKQAYINACKREARRLGIRHLPGRSMGLELPIFSGVDLAFSEKGGADFTALFTFTIMPDGVRIPLYIDYGRWPIDVVISKLLGLHDTFGGVITVENNGAQKAVVEIFRKMDRSVPVRSHTTSSAKANPVWGVPALFTEMSNGAWAIPCDEQLRITDPRVQKWVDECLNYKPGEHTGDILMASYFARDTARKAGALMSAQRRAAGTSGPGAGIAANLMSR